MLKYVSTGKAVLRGKFTTLMDFQKIGKTKKDAERRFEIPGSFPEDGHLGESFPPKD